jgi:hypothetical protein
VIDTTGSFVKYNAPEDIDANKNTGAGYIKKIVTDSFDVQVQVYQTAILSRNLNKALKPKPDPGRYQFPKCNCGTWVNTMLKRNELKLPDGFINFGTDLGYGLDYTGIPQFVTIMAEGYNPGPNQNGGINVFNWSF